MAMTDRERILAILDGRSPDRIPWIPRLRLWYNARQLEGNMPARFQGMSEDEVGRALGIGNPARDGPIFKIRYAGMEVDMEKGPEFARTVFHTPYGDIVLAETTTSYLVGRSLAGWPTEHPIRTVDDFRAWEYVAEHTYYDPTYAEYLAYEQQIGDEGYPMANAGDCPFHYFLVHLAGYNDAYLLIADHPREFEHLMAVMAEVERERLWPVVANSPARLIMHGYQFDSQMTPPKMFRKYVTPYYEEFSDLLHARGKKLAWHADDDAKAILRETKEAGFDMAECFCTAPMVSVTLAEARAAWGTDVIIWGGVPSVVLEEEFPAEEFEEYMRSVFRAIAPGDAFILGAADNVMPTSLIERVERITELVEQHGRYPIEPY